MSARERPTRKGSLMAEVCTLDWHIAPFRADRWLDLWEPAAARMPAYGAKSWSLTRSIDDPLALPADLDLGEPRRLRTLLVLGGDRAPARAVIDLYDKPLLPAWHTLLAAE